MSNEEKIAAVVVTYNRKELLKECLNALLNQTRKLDSIIIMNNASTDGTEEMLKKEYLDNPIFDYVNLGENLGGAGGFHYGMKRAYEKGFDWIWVMDDDANPYKNALEELMKYKSQDRVLNSLVKGVNSNELSFGLRDYKNNRTYFFIDELGSAKKIYGGNPFNCTLIPREVISKIGLPIKELFIWGDEREYYRRILAHGFDFVTVVESVTEHPKMNQRKTIFGYRQVNVPLWKRYYEYRNSILIEKALGNDWRVLLQSAIVPARRAIGILLYENNKIKRLKVLSIGTVHGILGRKGRYDNAFNF